MELTFIRERITQLRIQKGVSEYQMSRELGHAKNYIQKIASGQSLPSLSEFIYICDYFGIAPKEFFDREVINPAMLQRAVDGLRALTQEDLDVLVPLIEHMREEKRQ